MLVFDVMDTDPPAIQADDPISFARLVMRCREASLVPVLRGTVLVGAVDQDDLWPGGIERAPGPFEDLPVAEVMRAGWPVLAPEMSLEAAAETFAAGEVDYLPVAVDGRLIGVAASFEVLLRLQERRSRQRTAVHPAVRAAPPR